MDYFQSAKELVNYANNSYSKIKKAYEDSLHERSIKTALLIEIKNFMENLRSALDYSAHGLFDKYGDKTKNQNIYFPYAWEGLSYNDFRSKNIIEKNIPGLSKNRPDIVKIIEGYQSFSSNENDWLPKFMDLNNENKHQNLTPQIRKEAKQLNISSGGVSISMGESCRIEMGSGTMIQMGGAVIPGGLRIDVNNPARIFGQAKQEIITWVSFRFESNDEPVLPLLEKSLNGISKIINELSKL